MTLRRSQSRRLSKEDRGFPAKEKPSCCSNAYMTLQNGTSLTAIPNVSAIRSGSSFSKLVCYGNVARLGDNMPNEISDLYCEPCRISFKNPAALCSHRNSQAHRLAERVCSIRSQTSACRALSLKDSSHSEKCSPLRVSRGSAGRRAGP